MTEEVLSFFASCPQALPIYEELERAVRTIEPQTSIRVKRTQIGFFCGCGFAFASRLRVGGAQRREPWLTLTLALGRPLTEAEVSTEPYPGRWTNHLLLLSPKDIGPELRALLKEAADFAAFRAQRGKG